MRRAASGPLHQLPMVLPTGNLPGSNPTHSGSVPPPRPRYHPVHFYLVPRDGSALLQPGLAALGFTALRSLCASGGSAVLAPRVNNGQGLEHGIDQL